MTMRPLVAFLVVVASATTVAAALATNRTHPSLRLASVNPLVITGSGFQPGERVTVTTLTTVRKKRVVVLATARGRIKVSFGKLTQPCATPFAVRAMGARSGVALARVAAQPCVPPPIQ